MSVQYPSNPSLWAAFGRNLGQRVRGFLRAETGTVTVESVIILPVILFGLQATFAYFESYRRQNLVLKANYAISDYLSRVHVIDSAMLEGLDELFEYMTQTGEDSWLRVTVVRCRRSNVAKCNDESPRLLGRYWSKTTNGATKHTRTTMRSYLGPYIPKMYNGEDLIVVETVAKFEPSFAGRWTGIYSTDMAEVIVTSPREYETLCWRTNPEDCPEPNTTL